MLGAGARDADDVHFLKGVIADERRGNLTGKNDERNGIAVRRGDPGHSIGGTGAGRGKTNAHLARSARIAVSGMDSPLFMPHENMADIRVAGQFVVDVDDRPAGIPEEEVNALALQTFQKNPGPGAYHQLPSCSL